MSRLRTIVIAAASLGAAAKCLAAQPMGRPPGSPPREAFEACAAKADGDSCRIQTSPAVIDGKCRAPQGRALVCVPGNGPPPRGGPDGAGVAANEATRLSTAGVACSVSHNASNPSTGLRSRYAWSCAGGQRRLVANGIPDHAIGAFPNAGNPNRPSEQNVDFQTTLAPVATKGAGLASKISGYALNGVKFDPGTAEACDETCANRGRGRNGEWRIEALGQRFFDFGVDANNAHVQPNGAYHYHGMPIGMMPQGGRVATMTLVGFAIDGFPIYARYGHSAAMDVASALRPMRSSYRLKTTPDAGRPPTSVAPMGTFTQDYEYVAGLGDLDECNGRTDASPEFPKGAYHYYVTDSYPYVQRCVKGEPSSLTTDEPPPGQFGGPQR